MKFKEFYDKIYNSTTSTLYGLSLLRFLLFIITYLALDEILYNLRIYSYIYKNTKLQYEINWFQLIGTFVIYYLGVCLISGNVISKIYTNKYFNFKMIFSVFFKYTTMFIIYILLLMLPIYKSQYGVYVAFGIIIIVGIIINSFLRNFYNNVSKDYNIWRSIKDNKFAFKFNWKYILINIVTFSLSQPFLYINNNIKIKKELTGH